MTLFPAGTVVGTGIGVYEHVGVMTDSGTIVSASKSPSGKFMSKRSIV